MLLLSKAIIEVKKPFSQDLEAIKSDKRVAKLDLAIIKVI